MQIWRGKRRTTDAPAKFVAERDFWFGGKMIPKGSRVKQFETTNFGWTHWVDPKGETHLAKE